jgi:hypothetical protein
MKRLRLIAVLGFGAVLTALGAAIAPALAGDGPLSPELQEVRKAVARYHSAEQALKDGYVFEEGEPCVASPPAPPDPDHGGGTMGIHAPNPPLLMNNAIDPLRPELLLYVPNGNGNLKLVGVEYWKVDNDQNLATDDDRPSLFGEDFDGPMEGHNPTMPRHYDLHVWVAEANPSDVFAMFNPAISC